MRKADVSHLTRLRIVLGLKPLIHLCALFVDTSSIHFFMEVLTIANYDKNQPVNENIRVSEMLVIGPNGEQLGIKSKRDAITLAGYAGFDLVLVNDTINPPVAKIMDYNKFRYENQKKQKEANKKQKTNNQLFKEYRLSPNIDIHDIETKLKNVRKYLEKGSKIKVSVRFRGRQMAHTEIGRDVLMKFYDKISDIADMDVEPKMEGYMMSILLIPKK